MAIARKMIHDHAGRNNDHPLPDRFRTEFPRLGFVIDEFGIEALIDHSGYFHITADGDPRNAIIGLADFFAESARRKSDRESIDAHPACLRSNKMSEFVDKDQHADRD